MSGETELGIGLLGVSLAFGLTGPGLFVGGWALGQLWLFWIAPIAGPPSLDQ